MLVRNAAVILIMLVPAGMAWLAVLSSINAALQLFLPAWVRARGLGIYQMVLFGAQAGGAVLWGLLASPLGLVTTFLLRPWSWARAQPRCAGGRSWTHRGWTAAARCTGRSPSSSWSPTRTVDRWW